MRDLFFVHVPDWQNDAACREVDGALFYPPEDSRGLDAKAVCRICPVIADCLDYALTFEAEHPGSRWGVFGGQTARQRKRTAAARKQARA